MSTVLFVCLHNAGRSQMSSALFERAAAGRHTALSAGSIADPDGRVHEEVVAVMAELGIDLSDRRPARLTRELAEQADVVVDDGLRRRLPLHPEQALHRLGSAGPEGPLDRRGARYAHEITWRVAELLETLAPR